MSDDDRRPAPPADVLEGTVERVTFANEETGFCVLKVASPGRREPVSVVGTVLGAQPGETLRLTGSWQTDKKFGEQFRATSYALQKPATLLGIERYLGSGMVPGVGKALAERMVARFGLDTLDVIERDPARLAEVEGIGPVRTARIQRAFLEQRGVRDVMVFLQAQGVSSAFASRIYKQYRDRAIAIVRADPYRLALDIAGIGFLSADRIAQNLGIARDAPRRIEAGVLHALSELASAGNVGARHPALVEAAVALLGVDTLAVETAIDAAALARSVVVESPGTPDDRVVFLAHLHAAEASLASRLRALVATAEGRLGIDVDEAIARFERTRDLALAPAQREAIRRAALGKVLVVTGGPGTGKTTLVNGLLAVFVAASQRIALAAPTGRAAKRMAEATGHEARTIHRLLEWSPKGGGFTRDAATPLDADLVVIDEASMLDTQLADKLLAAVPLGARLVLVGDVDQLPSVGPGSVLAEIIASGQVDVVRLTQIFRQAEQSLIVVNAHRIHDGEMPLAKSGADDDFYFVERETPEAILATVHELVSSRIPRRFGLDPIDDVQVLTPMHRGLLGAASLNQELQARLNPLGASIERGARTFRVADKVMQLRNDYERDVYNGDVGRVARVSPEERTLVVTLDGREVVYEGDELDDLALAYACSVHKSQGSEYPAVVLALHTQHYVMLRRNLLYTAVTRGRRLVVIVGSAKALRIALAADKVERRVTRLADRLAGRA